VIRLLRPSDRAFVANSWLRSYEGVPEMPRPRYWQTYSAIVDGILDRCPVTVLCNPEDEGQILAWACHASDPAVLHYVYVKAAFRDARGTGEQPRLAMAILEHLGLSDRPFATTFSTRAWVRYSAKHGINYLHVPHTVPRMKELRCE
jgi:hypothetical protein